MFKKHVVIVGPVTIDDVVQGKGRERKLGGVTTYAGLTFTRHGMDVSVVSNVAPQDETILQRLYTEDISISLGTSRHTTRFVHYPHGDDRRQELPRIADPIEYTQIINHLTPDSLLHLGPLYPTDIARDVFRQLRRSEVFISLDLQGYVRSRKHYRVHPVVSKYLPEALAVSNIVKAAHEELELILHLYGMTLPVFMKNYNIQEMVITSGSHGGVVRNWAGQEIHYQAPQVCAVVDSTGAGDVFFAAYLTHRFFHLRSISDSAVLAARVAARHIEGRYILPHQLILRCHVPQFPPFVKGRKTFPYLCDLTPRPPSLQGKGGTNSPRLAGEGLGERSNVT